MKKLMVFALVILFVFSMAAIAGAGPFPGAQPKNPERADAPGYLAWSSAMEQMDAESVTLNVDGFFDFNWAVDEMYDNPHGGYVTATRKCAVCHSVHRATTANNAVGRTDITPMLTGVGSACLNCHGTDGSVATNKPVEWPEAPIGSKTAHSGTGCVLCHKGSIHGRTSSKYFGMNTFLLGDDRNSDLNIATELAAGNISDLGFTDVFATIKGTPAYGDLSSAKTSWTPAFRGGVPITLSEMASVKANAAGFTCSRDGCHNNSMYAMNYWGFAALRDTDVDAATPAVPATGHRTTPGVASGSMASLNVMRPAGANPYVAGNTAPCGPCHPGQVSGGYRGNATLPTGTTFAIQAADRSRAYGCDQCHDMIGAKSGTTCWPHANGGIPVIEWPSNMYAAGIPAPGYANPEVKANQVRRNLWMYAANALENPVSVDSMGASGLVTVPAGTVMDGRVRVIENARFGYNPGFAAGNTKDGACLKCHVPVDEKSLEAVAVQYMLNGYAQSWPYGAAGIGEAKAGMHYAGVSIDSNPAPKTFGAEPAGVDAAALIFTYR